MSSKEKTEKSLKLNNNEPTKELEKKHIQEES